VKIMREGKPAQLSDFREGDRLSATIITSGPPKVVSEKEVRAIVPTATATTGSAPPVEAATAPQTASAVTTPPAPTAQAPTSAAASELPKTASSWPLLAFASVLSLLVGLALAVRRRLVS
jgi:LPXTG-motif cell wall-anchored protein